MGPESEVPFLHSDFHSWSSTELCPVGHLFVSLALFTSPRKWVSGKETSWGFVKDCQAFLWLPWSHSGWLGYGTSDPDVYLEASLETRFPTAHITVEAAEAQVS